ncbi:hypothetical protein V1520DRAFT_387893 [Lipomyces starkeyi]
MSASAFRLLKLGDMCKKNALPPRPTVPEDEIEEVFIKGRVTPEDQHCKEQLRHIPTGFVVSSQPTRSREQKRGITGRYGWRKQKHLEAGAREDISAGSEVTLTSAVPDSKVRSDATEGQ